MTVTFYVTPLDSSCSVVLGLDWLTRYNPSIDWVLRSLTFRTTRTKPTLMTSPAPEQAPPQSLPSVPPESVSPVPPHISFVNAAAFVRACKLPGSQTFRLQASATFEATPADLTNVPEEYHDFADVFSKAKSDRLPEHRPYDLKINLEEGTEPPLGTMYSISQVELQALRAFLDENLNSGMI